MQCRQCGCQIPEKLKQREVIQCPRCGKKYQRKAAPTPEGNVQRKRRKQSGAPPRRHRPLLVAGLVLFLIVDCLILSLAVTGKISLTGKKKEPAAEETWEERFARTEDEVSRYVDEVILGSCALSMKTHLACDTQEDVYYAYVDPILDPADGASFRRAVRQITDALKASPYTITLYVTFTDAREQPLCVTCLGYGYEEDFSFVRNAKMVRIAVNDIPNDVFSE